MRSFLCNLSDIFGAAASRYLAAMDDEPADGADTADDYAGGSGKFDCGTDLDDAPTLDLAMTGTATADLETMRREFKLDTYWREDAEDGK